MLWYYLRILVILFFGLISFSDPVMANNVLEAQKMLTKLGYAPGPIDGAYGDKTKRALVNYYNAQNKKFDGKLDENEIADLKVSIKVFKAPEPKIKKSRHIQHARYSKHIATLFRDLKVSKDFTLIDDFETFMGFHKSYLNGKLPDNVGFFSYGSEVQNIDFDFCVEDIISTTTKKANPSVGVQNVTAVCGAMISQRFLNNSENGIKNYQKIILAWLESGIIHNPNKFGKKLPQKIMDEWPYAISSNVPQILTHYALYHKLYNFDQYTHERVIKMGDAFFTQWDYYPLLTRGSSYKQKLCNLKSQYNVVIGTNDHCGSFNARMATGGIIFGLEFTSQLAFDTGVRHLEIMLATFNKDAVYTAQAQRGICAIGYMKQFPPHFELIHYALSKAYNIDFINTQNINGVTPAEAFLKLWKIAHDPLGLVVKYWNKKDQMSCSDNGKNQAAMVAQLKRDPSSYQDFWNGFSYEDFLLSSPILASQELPEEWKAFDKSKVRQGRAVLQTIAGGDWIGINPYLLQLALGNFEYKRREYDEELNKKKVELQRIKEQERNKKKVERKKLIAPVKFGSVYADVSSRDGNYQQVFFSVKKLLVGSQLYNKYEFILMIDYAPESSSRGLTDLLRIQVSNNDMIPKSELTKLENCKHILWKKTNSIVKLHFLIGNEAEINPCILQYVQPNKRNLLGSIAHALPEILEAGLAKKPEQLDDIMVLLNDARQREE